ncbi:uncharacterized protein LOC104583401 [Brachypodium distachyon]|uniref:Uncharacterized protein n=1 Tax=Brachypodium distachyon TaxID=15368 RepID=I1HW47_BRADI|nr:uncharacterized protein LOC104583401 [Brachypodium distachyon]XP_024317760.1 uncharacterized protein LOC104583401 [Brachypodium distachyon]XP_024317761.1 uncharacterized protein LOC104583401 [Brachypodium distachyon]KQJ92808.1 hypothetical protein BRADI_3g00830v3 [Brachypodium distachyon]|eukprot:XP_024317759.1 uncharacterized protein LOC104583401 [Brachypodium distachyon]
MLGLRTCILTRLLSSSRPASSGSSSLHRLLSAAAVAPAVSPNPSFAVEDYLVETCGLTRAQALKASAKLSHLKSPTNPDAVVAFFSGLGLSSADIAAVVVRDPRFLCAGVDKTLGAIVADLTSLGLSRSEIARIFLLGGCHSRSRSIVSKLQYYLPLFGSFERLQKVFYHASYLLGADPEKTVKPNVAFLRECGLRPSDIVNLSTPVPMMLSTNPSRVRAMAALAEGLGVPRCTGMFKYALYAVAFLSKEKIACKVEYLKKTFRWSDAETRIAISKAPTLLRRSKDVLQSRSEFFISEAGLEPAYIAHRPCLVTYSLEGRSRPRYYAVKFLKANGLLDHNRDYCKTVLISEKVFLEKYICPHKEAAPHLAEDYAAACRGEMPTRFRFT